MLIVGTDPTVVEADLVAGRLACPKCGRALRRWGFAKRRELRRRTGGQWLSPHLRLTSRCRSDEGGRLPSGSRRAWNRGGHS